MKSLYCSRTFWVAVLQGVSGALLMMETSHARIGAFMVLKAIVDVFLRVLTNKSVYVI